VHCADERRGAVQEQLVSVFERYGIRVGHSRPYHPQTQGKPERAFDHWRTVCKLGHPHKAPEMAVAPPLYRPSSRLLKKAAARILSFCLR